MKLLNSKMLSVEENIALDKKLLEQVGNGEIPPLFRFYNCSDDAVVVGISQKIEDYVNVEQCEKDGILILKRFSGGGTVFIGKGCLVYSIIDKFGSKLKRFDVSGAYQHFLSPVIDNFCFKCYHNGSRLKIPAEFYKPCDIAVNNRKITGNAQAQKFGAVIVHGSFLINADLEKISKYLKHPEIEPDYRSKRSHEDFLCNLSEFGLTYEKTKEILKKAWGGI